MLAAATSVAKARSESAISVSCPRRRGLVKPLPQDTALVVGVNPVSRRLD